MTRPHDAPRRLEAAERLFFGSEPSLLLSSLLDPRRREEAEDLLFGLDPIASPYLLPYLLDHHGPGSRRDVLRDPRRSSVRERKKSEGIFYTPRDVAEYMTAWVLQDSAAPTVLDPACGTGVFLLSVAATLHSKGASVSEI